MFLESSILLFNQPFHLQKQLQMQHSKNAKIHNIYVFFVMIF